MAHTQEQEKSHLYRVYFSHPWTFFADVTRSTRQSGPYFLRIFQ